MLSLHIFDDSYWPVFTAQNVLDHQCTNWSRKQLQVISEMLLVAFAPNCTTSFAQSVW
jgi:hypothetical protein